MPPDYSRLAEAAGRDADLAFGGGGRGTVRFDAPIPLSGTGEPDVVVVLAGAILDRGGRGDRLTGFKDLDGELGWIDGRLVVVGDGDGDAGGVADDGLHGGIDPRSEIETGGGAGGDDGDGRGLLAGLAGDQASFPGQIGTGRSGVVVATGRAWLQAADALQAGSRRSGVLLSGGTAWLERARAGERGPWRAGIAALATGRDTGLQCAAALQAGTGYGGVVLASCRARLQGAGAGEVGAQCRAGLLPSSRTGLERSGALQVGTGRGGVLLAGGAAGRKGARS